MPSPHPIPRAVSRAVALAAALALGLSALGAAPAEAARAHARREAAPAAPPPPVDVSRLRQLGLGDMADALQGALTSDLRQQGVTDRAGGRVVVRLTGLSLAPFAGADSGGGGPNGGGGSGGNFDYLDGEVLVLGPRGEILSSRPQLVSLSATSGGAYYLPGFDQRRIAALSRAYAAWVAKSL